MTLSPDQYSVSDESAPASRIPIWFAALLAGQVAGLLATIGVLVCGLQLNHWHLTNRWPVGLGLLVPNVLIGVAIVCLIYLPFRSLLAAMRVTSRLAYVAIALMTFGGLYLLALPIFVPGDYLTFSDRVDAALKNSFSSFAILIPLVSIPTGLLFHFVEQARPPQPFSSIDAPIFAIWLMVWLASFCAYWPLDRAHHYQLAFDDNWRWQVCAWVARLCTIGIPLVAMLAGFFRLRNERVALLVCRVCWTSPILVVLALALVESSRITP